ITGIEDDPTNLKLTTERGELNGRSAAAGDRGLPVPHQLLRQDNHSRQRPRPHKISGASLEKIRLPAITRDQHTSAVTTQPRRSCPCPTGTWPLGSHRSHWMSSPGR